MHGNATVTIAHWVEPQKQSGGFSPTACSYGAIIDMDGAIRRKLWGAGYASYPILPLSFAIAASLKFLPPECRLIIHGIEELGQYFGPIGYVAAASRRGGCNRQGKPMAGFQHLRAVQDAMGHGKWDLIAHKDIWEAPNYFEARVLADEPGRQRAEAHKRSIGVRNEHLLEPQVVHEEVVDDCA